MPLSTKLSEKTQSVIVLCAGDRYELDKEIISQCQMISVPTVAVTIADGNTLIKLLSPDAKVEVSIDNITTDFVTISEETPLGKCMKLSIFNHLCHITHDYMIIFIINPT